MNTHTDHELVALAMIGHDFFAAKVQLSEQDSYYDLLFWEVK